MALRKMLKKPALIPQKLYFESSLFSSLVSYTYGIMMLHQRPLRIIYDTLSLTDSTLLTADIILRFTKNPVPN